MKKRIVKKKNRSYYFLIYLLILVLIGLILTVVMKLGAIGEKRDLKLQPTTWRSSLFPVNWVPVDQKVIMGVNVFLDSEGTKDQLGRVITNQLDPRYHPNKFLHDFSYAGYRAGETIPPRISSCLNRGKRVFDVTKSPYNCVPNPAKSIGGTDCRAAIQRAIDDAESAGGGVVYMPEGEYMINTEPTKNDYFLEITSNNVVLCGAGPDKTFLKYNSHLPSGEFDILNNKGILVRRTDVSDPWSQIWIPLLGTSVSITANLDYPTKEIPVSSTTPFKVGDEIIIRGIYTSAFLAEHDMAGAYGVPAQWPLGGDAYLFRRTITGVDIINKKIMIDVPTRYRIKTTDSPILAKTAPSISEVGLENFAIGMIRHPDEFVGCEFSSTSKCLDRTDAALREKYAVLQAIAYSNAISFQDVANSWVYKIYTYVPKENVGRPASGQNWDIEILNGMFSVFFGRQITVENFNWGAAQALAGGGTGYASGIDAANEVLIQNGNYYHVKKAFSLNANRPNSGNVFKDLTIRNLAGDISPNDYHGRLSVGNLIENIDLGNGMLEASVRPFGNNDGHGGTQGVFWNIHTTGSVLFYERWDYDTNNDGVIDPCNPYTTVSCREYPIIASNQFGWGYVIGTYGLNNHAVTANMPNRFYSKSTDLWRPYILPRDHREGIGYDALGMGQLEPRSLYEAQLALRTGTQTDCSINDLDGDEYGVGCALGLDCNDNNANIHPGAVEICGNLVDENCDGGDLPCAIVRQNETIIDNTDSGFTAEGEWLVSGGASPYGSNSVYSKKIGDNASWASTFSRGIYDIRVWWTWYNSRPLNASYYIYDGDNLIGIRKVNQRDQTISSTWYSIGEFSCGNQLTVKLRVERNDSYSADAVIFVKTGDIVNCIPQQEVCDGIDNDCDNEIDEGVKTSYYRDSDGDTYGAGTPIENCIVPSGYVLNNNDCNDNSNLVNLLKSCVYNGNSCGAFNLCVASCPLPPVEICGNGIDEDCNGEDLVCSIGLPVLNVIQPVDKFTYRNVPVRLQFSASGASNCWYVLDGTRVNTPCGVDTILMFGRGSQTHVILINANNTRGVVTKKITFTVNYNRRYVISYNSFTDSTAGESFSPEQMQTTELDDFSDEELENVLLVLDDGKFGKIEFLEGIDLTQDANRNNGLIDLDSNVILSENTAEIKTDVMPSLNKRARVTLNGLKFKSPMILKDGYLCDGCRIESYSNDEIIFLVNDFSRYSVQETPFNDYMEISSGTKDIGVVKTEVFEENVESSYSFGKKLLLLSLIILLVIVGLSFYIAKLLTRSTYSNK